MSHSVASDSVNSPQQGRCREHPGCSWVFLPEPECTELLNPFNFLFYRPSPLPMGHDSDHHFDLQTSKLHQPNIVCGPRGSSHCVLLPFLSAFLLSLCAIFTLLYHYITIDNKQNGYVHPFHCNQNISKYIDTDI